MYSYNDLYLEAIKDKKALSWVKSQNKRSLNSLISHPRFEELKNHKKNLLESEDQLLYPFLQANGFVYNFWRDKKYKRGLLRRTDLKNYLSGNYQWEEVLDLDALAEQEKESWVYSGSVHHPEGKKVFFHLSRGGQDAVVVREFDLVKKEFVKEGFYLPEARSDVAWLSENEIAVATDWKTADSLTDSNYPRIVKTIKREDSEDHYVTIFSVEKTDMVVSLDILPSEEKGDRLVLFQKKNFFSEEIFLQQENEKIIKIPLPPHAKVHTPFRGSLVFKLNKDWTWGGQTYNTGSFLIADPDKMIEGDPSSVQLLMEPSSEKILDYATATKNRIYISILENVKSSIVELKPEVQSWRKTSLPFPKFGNISIVNSNPRNPDVFFTSEGFLESPGLYHYVSGKLTKIQELPPRFDPNSYQVEQFFAKSFDNTKIPYFIVSKKGLKHNGKNPILLEAYGGFEINQLPFYSAISEFAWYRKGGVFVLANIRGGGEYGPEWHQAGLKEKRQTVFNDFYAVAEDLIQKKVTAPSHLGIMGGSNGGLLMGVAMTQKPELFRAVLIGNPLLDMLRYHKLSVGSSWIAEYGDPENPKIHKFIKSYSPYQNLDSNKDYPEVFLFTSTLDDRVHPGHARRFARKLEKFNKPFYYYENTEGGHSSASNYEQKAILITLNYVYLYKKLMDN